MKRKDVTIWGSPFMAILRKYISKEFKIVEEIYGESPFTASIKKKEKAEGIFVLDLRDMEQMITVEVDGGEGAKSFEPEKMEYEWLNKKLNCFAESVLKSYKPEDIYLVKTHIPRMWLAGTHMRVTGDLFEGAYWYNPEFKKLEQAFIDATGCKVIDLQRFYFNDKKPGYKVTNYTFEHWCYRDVVYQIVKDQSGEGLPKGPYIEYSLERYIDYYFTLEMYAMKFFLNPKIKADALVLAASDKAAKKYKEELIALKRGTRTELTELLCIAMDKIEKEEYVDKSVDYSILFRNDFCPRDLVKILQKYFENNKEIVLPRKINRDNAGYYFAKMQNNILGENYFNPEEYKGPNTVVDPPLVDVWGTCVSMTNFNVQDNDVAINNYWFHVLPFEQEGFEYDPELFDRPLNWTDRLVKQQFERNIFQPIIDSDAEWLILDWHGLFSAYQYYVDGFLYTDYDGNVSKQVGAKVVKIWKDSSIMGEWKEILAKTDKWCEVVKAKYKDRIIMVNSVRMQHWIGDNRMIYKFKTDYSIDNQFMEVCFKYFKEKLDCYTIDYAPHYLGEEYGYMKRAAAHFSTKCYQATHDTIADILYGRAKKRHYKKFKIYIKGKFREEYISKDKKKKHADKPVERLYSYKNCNTIGWEAEEGTKAVNIYRRVSGNKRNPWTLIARVDNLEQLEYTDELSEKRLFSYKLEKVYSIEGFEARYAFSPDAHTIEIESAPEITSSKKVEGGLELVWEARKRANAYRIYKCEPGEQEYKLLESVDENTTTFVDEEYTPGAKYRVETYRKKGKVISESSNAEEILAK